MPLVALETAFRLNTGDRIALIGPSGGGKSTLLRGLVRLNPIQGTRYQLGDQDGFTLPPRELRRRVGYVAQVPMALPGDALENGRLTLSFVGPVPADWQGLVEASLRWAGLGESHWQTEASELSVGQRMRLALARAHVLEPSILLLDEPFAPLDPESRAHLVQSLRTWSETGDRALIAVFHDREMLDQLATDVWELADGTTLRTRSRM